MDALAFARATMLVANKVTYTNTIRQPNINKETSVTVLIDLVS
jgi:hypothetical protein